MGRRTCHGYNKDYPYNIVMYTIQHTYVLGLGSDVLICNINLRFKFVSGYNLDPDTRTY